MNLQTVLLISIYAVSAAGQQGRDTYGLCYTDQECEAEGASCVFWAGCSMGTCSCSSDPAATFGCLWKKVGDSCEEEDTKNDCTGPPAECRDGKCACPVNQSPSKHSLYWCDDLEKDGRECSEDTVLKRGESCVNGTVDCWADYREDPRTGECRSGMPGETCVKNEECESNNCTASKCVCAEGMVMYTERVSFYSGKGYNMTSINKCKHAEGTTKSVSVGAHCGGYITCQGSTCMECPEGGVSVCVDISSISLKTNAASSNYPKVVTSLLLLIASQIGRRNFC